MSYIHIIMIWYYLRLLASSGTLSLDSLVLYSNAHYVVVSKNTPSDNYKAVMLKYEIY